MGELPRLLTVRSARRYGVTARQLEGRRFRRLVRGVYVFGSAAPTLTERAAAALLVLPKDAVITGVTALWLHGAELGSPEPIRVAIVANRQTKLSSVRLSRLAVLPESRGRVAVPAAAWLTACGDLDLVQAVAAADRLIRLGKITESQLREVAETATGRGCRLGRRAAALARAGVDSPRETRLRLLLVLAGLPEPACNPMIGSRTAPIGHFDLVLGEFMIVIEYDGDHHRTDPVQWSRDIARHEAAVGAGYAVVRVTNGRMAQPREIAQTVHTQLTEGGYRGPAPTYSPEWCTLFGWTRSPSVTLSLNRLDLRGKGHSRGAEHVRVVSGDGGAGRLAKSSSRLHRSGGDGIGAGRLDRVPPRRNRATWRGPARLSDVRCRPGGGCGRCRVPRGRLRELAGPRLRAGSANGLDGTAGGRVGADDQRCIPNSDS